MENIHDNLIKMGYDAYYSKCFRNPSYIHNSMTLKLVKIVKPMHMRFRIAPRTLMMKKS